MRRPVSASSIGTGPGCTSLVGPAKRRRANRMAHRVRPSVKRAGNQMCRSSVLRPQDDNDPARNTSRCSVSAPALALQAPHDPHSVSRISAALEMAQQRNHAGTCAVDMEARVLTFEQRGWLRGRLRQKRLSRTFPTYVRLSEGRDRLEARKPGRKIMRKQSAVGLVVGTALLCAAPFSLQWSSEKSPSLSLDKANAVIGRPLTPGSVAGVHRRVYRRTARRAYYYSHGRRIYY